MKSRFRLKNVIAVDLPLGSVAFFILILILVIPFINPVPADTDVPPPGQIYVKITWNAHTDVDLWLKSPDDAKAVGYSRKDGQTSFALLRDDLGTDPDPRNEETGFARSMPAGRYVVNLHLFRGKPLPVHVEITLLPPGKPAIKIFDETVELYVEKQERTVVSFQIDGNGALVPFSANRVFIPLRTGAK